MLHGAELVLGVAALGLVSFISVVDLTIVNVILPAIGATFSATPHEVTMGITCFATAQAAATPLTGWLANRFGVVRVFMLGLLLFGATSFLCGVAPTLGLFILARILQGFSAGPMLPLVQTLLQRCVPKPQLPAAIAFWAVVISIGPLFGPILGGAITDSIGWPWGFYINIPFVLLAVVIIWRVFGSRETPKVRVRLDTVGLVLMLIWVGALQFVLDKGVDLEWFASPLILWLSVTAVIAFVAFMIWELTDPHPLIDFSVFRYRSFRFGVPVSAVSYSSLVIGNLLLTLWLQVSIGYTATWAGYAVGVMGVSSVLAGPLSAMLTRRLDPRLVVCLFMSLSCIGFFLRSRLPTDADFRSIALIQLWLGMTSTAAMGPIFAMVMGDIPHPKLPGAAGLLTFTRMLAVGVVTALMTTGWTYGQIRAHSDMAGTFNATSPDLLRFQTPHGMSQQALVLWNGVIDQEAITLSTQHMLLWLILYASIGPLMIWLCPRPRAAAVHVTPAE